MSALDALTNNVLDLLIRGRSIPAAVSVLRHQFPHVRSNISPRDQECVSRLAKASCELYSTCTASRKGALHTEFLSVTSTITASLYSGRVLIGLILPYLPCSGIPKPILRTGRTRLKTIQYQKL